MFPKRIAWAGIGLFFFLFARQTAWAGLPVSGNVNRDTALDIADAVSLVEVVDDTTTPTTAFPFFEGLRLDANRDDTVDANDLQYVLDIILGRAPLIPFSPQTPVTVVTFWRQQSLPTEPVEQNQDPRTRVSFWRQPAPPTSGDVQMHDVQPVLVSFWRRPSPPESTEVREHDVRPVAVSFWLQPAAPDPMHVEGHDARLSGAPSFDRE